MTPKTVMAWLTLARKRNKNKTATDMMTQAMAARAKPEALQSEVKKLLAE